MDRKLLKKAFFLFLVACSTMPFVKAPGALMAGIAFSLLLGTPFPEQVSRWSKRLLQISVVGLGFGINLTDVLDVGRSSFLITIAGITVTMMAGWLLGRICGTERNTSLLISFGTAICGGSAIAALAPVLKAENDEVAVSLATVFTLNSAALLIFPVVGHALGIGQHAFGVWAGLAIHDTSSVVGASAAYGPTALAVGTTVKLTRAIWITPSVLIASWLKKGAASTSVPLFIIGFLAAATLRFLLPTFDHVWQPIADSARQSLVVTLFLVGSGLSRAVLGTVGLRPLVQGVILWFLVSATALLAIMAGSIH